MYISFGRKLRRLGSVRFGFRMTNSRGCFYACLYVGLNAFIYLMWYSLLATFWLVYGMGYLFFYLPIKGIIKLCKKKKLGQEIAEAAVKYKSPFEEPSESKTKYSPPNFEE